MCAKHCEHLGTGSHFVAPKPTTNPTSSVLGSGKVLASYYYKDIENLAEVTDYPGGFAVVKADFGRMHLFASEAREEILRRMQEEALNHTGLTLRRKQAWMGLNFPTYLGLLLRR